MATLRTHFDVLALPVRYPLDLDELERRYREASRHWHPDRFSRAPASERAMVLSRATDLNQAYRVLKDEGRRAEYLLKLHGIDLASEEPGKQPKMAPEFLGEVMELREELADCRQAADGAQLHSTRQNIEQRIAKLRQAIGGGFATLEAGDRAALPELSTALLMCRYYQRFLDEISAIEESRAEAAEAAIPPAAAG